MQYYPRTTGLARRPGRHTKGELHEHHPLRGVAGLRARDTGPGAAVAGIISGILLGNVVALLLHTGFVIPWGWVMSGVLVCSLVGLTAGLYPAIKASRLDPIVALRYE